MSKTPDYFDPNSLFEDDGESQDAESGATPQFQEAERMFVEATYETADGVERESGGFFVDEDTVAIPIHLGTRSDPLAVGDEIHIETKFGGTDGRVKGFVDGEDVALVDVDDDMPQSVIRLADDDADAGQEVMALSRLKLDDGKALSVGHFGHVSGTDPTGASDQAVSGADFEPGMSGGVLVDADGRAVGKADARHEDANVGLVSSRSTLAAVLEAEHTGRFSDTPIEPKYPDGWEAIATSSEVEEAKRAAERAKNDAYRREQELATYRTQKYNAEHGIR